MRSSSAKRMPAAEEGGIPPQVSRLVLAFTALIGGFLIFRSAVVPRDFGASGFHREQAPASVASALMNHAGRNVCMDCHDDKAASFHGKYGVGCESCHGPSLKHAEDPESTKPFRPETRQFCARCHGKTPGRRVDFPQVDVKTHNPDTLCKDCHTIHPEATS